MTKQELQIKEVLERLEKDKQKCFFWVPEEDYTPYIKEIIDICFDWIEM